MEDAERRFWATSESCSPGQSANDPNRVQSEDDSRQADLDRWWADWTDDLPKIGTAPTDPSEAMDSDCEGQIPTAAEAADQQHDPQGSDAGTEEVDEEILSCCVCGEEKPRSQFYKRSQDARGVTYDCKACINVRRRATYRLDVSGNRKKSREYARRRSKRLRGSPTKPPVQGQLYVDPAELELEM